MFGGNRYSFFFPQQLNLSYQQQLCSDWTLHEGYVFKEKYYSDLVTSKVALNCQYHQTPFPFFLHRKNKTKMTRQLQSKTVYGDIFSL